LSDEADHALDTAEKSDQERWYEVGFVAESSDESEEEDTVVQETGVNVEGLESTVTVENTADKLIYPNGRISNAASMLLIMTFAITHRISGVALKDLLSLIDVHCLIPNPLIQSLYKFKQFFDMIQHPLKTHHYCFKCGIYLEEVWTVCPNTLCQQDFTSKNKAFFIELPISDQLKSMYKRVGFYNDTQHRFNRTNSVENMEDIYDGLVYQKHMQEGQFLADGNNISFLWNTDGVPVFKSSKCSIWPLYFVINELPPHKRWNKENVILGGLWFGETKPNMLTFLKPFTQSVSILKTNGMEVYSPDVQQHFKCHAMLLCGTCDLPAKALVYNMKQFNGEFGCPHCLQKGEQISLDSGGTVRIYPYIQGNPTDPLRTGDQTEKHARKATDERKPEFGIKGPSWLSSVPGYNIIEGNTIDYMHSVLLGVSKMLLKLWFDNNHSSELWYCGHEIKRVDSRLLEIKPPVNITRVPRSIENHRSYWKASEYRNWLLFYSVPVMNGILPAEYLLHHMLLVEAIYLLLNSSITPMMIAKADRLLNHYCFKMQSYYTGRQMTMNTHQLLHLTQVVLNFGPLYSYSCFAFEGMNGSLLNYIKGTQHIEKQITEAVYRVQMLPQLAHNTFLPGSESDALYHQMTCNLKIPEGAISINRNCIALGAVNKVAHLSDANHQRALSQFTKSKELSTFKRTILNKSTVVHSLAHTKTRKRNTYTISYKHQRMHFHGEILYFVADRMTCYAVIAPFSHPVFLLPKDEITMCTCQHIYMYKSKNDGSVHVIPTGDIESICISISLQSCITCVIEQPNTIEKD